MTREELQALQTPFKEKYKADPRSAVVEMTARGTLDPTSLACRIDHDRTETIAGLHPAAGGDCSSTCSGELLLESLIACAGVTLCAVATAMQIPLKGGQITATGTMDFRGTLGLDRETSVGLTSVKLEATLDADAEPHTLDKLLELTERYCVVAQTIKATTPIKLHRQ